MKVSTGFNYFPAVALPSHAAKSPHVKGSYRSWCRDSGHSYFRLSVLELVYFFIFLQIVNWLSVSAVKGYQSMQSSIFKAVLP